MCVLCVACSILLMRGDDAHVSFNLLAVRLYITRAWTVRSAWSQAMSFERIMWQKLRYTNAHFDVICVGKSVSECECNVNRRCARALHYSRCQYLSLSVAAGVVCWS